MTTALAAEPALGLVHDADCTPDRVEMYPATADPDGRAVVTRCIECGASHVEWTHPRTRHQHPPDPLMRAVDDGLSAWATAFIAAHHQDQRALTRRTNSD